MGSSSWIHVVSTRCISAIPRDKSRCCSHANGTQPCSWRMRSCPGSIPSRTSRLEGIENQLFDFLRMAFARAFQPGRKNKLTQLCFHVHRPPGLRRDPNSSNAFLKRGGRCTDQNITEDPQAEIEDGIRRIGQFPVDNQDNVSFRYPFHRQRHRHTPLF